MKIIFGFVTLIDLVSLLACNSPQELALTLSATSEIRDEVPMVEIPEGEFIMGTTTDDVAKFARKYYDDTRGKPTFFMYEEPQMLVLLPTFSIDQLEVTNARYRNCVQSEICPDLPPSQLYSHLDDQYTTSATYNNYPAMVNGQAAQIYCQWVGKRLPTEAEWEKAARGTDGRIYSWGNEWASDKFASRLSPVGTYPMDASPYNVLDMTGNAWEWTSSNYDLYPGNDRFEPNSPLTQLPVDNWVVRGSHIPLATASERRVSVRWHQPPNNENSLAGFRCVSGSEPISLDKALLRILDANPMPSLAQ